MTNKELITELRGHIREVPLTLLRDAADALEAAEKRIKELESQIPKEGEWVRIDKEQDSLDDVVWRYAKCTVCGDSRFAYYAARKNFRYCPNCGARMRTVTDCHTLEESER